jgi:nitrite reductase (NADH) large subunit
LKPLDLVVVGNGMVGHRLCEKLVEYDRDGRYRIVVVGEEPRPAYDRVHLTSYFTERSAEALALGTRSWYSRHGIDLRVAQRVVRLDRERHRVSIDDGSELPFDVLVLCTGSAPFVPNIPGVDKKGVFVYRTIEHLDAIIARAADVKCAAIIGGGLLG